MLKKIGLAVLIVAVSGALVWNFQEAVLDFLERGRDAALDPARRGASRAPSVKKTLYFAGAEKDLLVPYTVEVEIGKDNVDTLRNLLAALIAGPNGEGYAPVIPKGTKLRAAFPGPDGIAYVDFDETLRDAHPGGVWAELMTAYGVAGTVVKNFPDLFDRVVLLIGGQEAQSIAGSLAITGPLRVREELILDRFSAPPAGGSPSTAPNQAAVSGAPASAAGQPPASAVGVPSGNLPPVGGAPLPPVGEPQKKPDVDAVGAPGRSR
ncbi:MAG: GerMN domain-containing protein [Nitrospinae bacterium]|nr:GerMN domain-containing protein [Nitrospinota bacterium]